MTAIKPEDAWFNRIEQHPGEHILLSYPANHTQGKRAVGGKIFVTNYRIAFAPNRAEVGMGGKTMEFPVANITEVATDKPHYRITEIFSGAWRKRLAVASREPDSQNERADFFVVSRPDKVAEEVRAAIQDRYSRLTDRIRPTEGSLLRALRVLRGNTCPNEPPPC